jgi:hypothetical protein
MAETNRKVLICPNSEEECFYNGFCAQAIGGNRTAIDTETLPVEVSEVVKDDQCSEKRILALVSSALRKEVDPEIAADNFESATEIIIARSRFMDIPSSPSS